ncbi:MAG: ATP-binding cassette domain-containing protein [Oscillospiraceae bacterium]|nr:ATP-binding cassette domain-containing protein [Oscillospiraceae bacterium]
MADNIIEVKNLKKYFKTPHGTVHAVDDVSFNIERGKTLGVVGESGCGKSTLGRNIIRLQDPTAGQVIYDGQDITDLSNQQMKRMRHDLQIIFQDPYSSLNPRKTVMEIISEPILFNKLMKGSSKQDVEKRVRELMDTVGLAQRLINSYPHELDGGRRQRIGIARALSLNPKFIVCDEPVSALDVSIQAQVLNLLKDLQKEMGLTYMFITHDLSVVNYFSDDILVMYLGMVVEKAPAEVLFKNPIHPYTKALLSAILVPKVNGNPDHISLRGEVTSPINPPDECRFTRRCDYICDTCKAGTPPLIEIEPNHFVACHCVKPEGITLQRTVGV